MSDKRRFRRIHFTTGCSFTCGTLSRPAELVDISLNGALVRIGTGRCEAGSSCSLALYLDGLETPLIFDGEVAHSSDDRIGIRFITTDIESMIHLRRLLESNSVDPDRIIEELGEIIRG